MAEALIAVMSSLLPRLHTRVLASRRWTLREAPPSLVSNLEANRTYSDPGPAREVLDGDFLLLTWHSIY